MSGSRTRACGHGDSHERLQRRKRQQTADFWLLHGTHHATRRSANDLTTDIGAWMTRTNRCVAHFLEQYIEGCKHDAAALTQGTVKTCAQGSLPFTFKTAAVLSLEHTALEHTVLSLFLCSVEATSAKIKRHMLQHRVASTLEGYGTLSSK